MFDWLLWPCDRVMATLPQPIDPHSRELQWQPSTLYRYTHITCSHDLACTIPINSTWYFIVPSSPSTFRQCELLGASCQRWCRSNRSGRGRHGSLQDPIWVQLPIRCKAARSNVSEPKRSWQSRLMSFYTICAASLYVNMYIYTFKMFYILICWILLCVCNLWKWCLGFVDALSLC